MRLKAKRNDYLTLTIIIKRLATMPYHKKLQKEKGKEETKREKL